MKCRDRLVGGAVGGGDVRDVRDVRGGRMVATAVWSEVECSLTSGRK